MHKIVISEFQNGQERLINQLIKKVYDEFVSIDYTDEGNQFFYDWIKPSKIFERQQNNRTILVAMNGQKIVGMIEIRENCRISLLFVDKEYQRQGIAKRLFRESLKKCIQKDRKLNKFYVHASPYSITVYKKLGFTETSIIQEKFGMKYLPMEMIIHI
jgi:ribosomal protein S18 acetylase RimI-like enzyme